ncbi:hypothetical protein DQ353_17130 [Arthrobacter sp. AQ5-05]|nr:hypothetical protein DQ353_17130 [Arthrobacter sp. AQ5-05]
MTSVPPKSMMSGSIRVAYRWAKASGWPAAHSTNLDIVEFEGATPERPRLVGSPSMSKTCSPPPVSITSNFGGSVNVRMMK